MTTVPLELLNVFLTMKCNLQCSFCASTSHPFREEAMPEEALRSLAGDVRDSCAKGRLPGLKEVRLTGGEPLIASNLFLALELFDFLDARSLTTNAMLVGPAILSRLQRYNRRLSRR